MNATWIEQTEAFLKQKLDSGAYLNANPQAKAYRLEHSYRVANIGRQIARMEGFDETEIVITCLLHDVSYCEEFGENGWKEHGRRSAAIARPFLKELGLAADRIEDICYGIAIHVDDEADFPGERTPFALSVGTRITSTALTPIASTKRCPMTSSWSCLLTQSRTMSQNGSPVWGN